MKLCYHCMQQLPNEKANFCPRCGKSLKTEQQPVRFLKAGTILCRKFIVGYPLGAGGFGNTYIGWDNLLCRRVAIKEFYPEQYCTRGQDGRTVTVMDGKLKPRFQRGLQQFLAEARSVAALHEVQGVVEISNFFEENGTGYIVMEYLEGMDVKTILQRSGDKKDYEWIRRVMLTVLYTLKEIHKRGVLHRDISPDNIFVTTEGIIKLIDFGAAKQVSALENTSDIMLKAGYAPIEQYGRDFAQGPYTDLYAAAALFYRMLTGQKPIPANERLENDALIPPSEMGISIPKQAEMALMVCLNVIPEYRLQSAEEFMEALDGKFFIPVYEPEWILPPEEKKGIRGKFAGLPTAAKAALCAACICVIGGVAFSAAAAIKNAGTAATLDSNVVVMQDLRNKSREEAEDYIGKLSLSHPGWKIQLDMTDSVFDLTKENGTVCEQSVAPGAILYEPGRELLDEKAGGLAYDEDGNLSGTISVTLYSNERLRYGEITEMNAYALAQKLYIDPEDEEHFVEEEGEEGSNYYDLAYLEAGGKKISAKELSKEKNADKTVSYSRDIKIHYYASDFFYWKKLPDFAAEYGEIDKAPEQTVYRYTDENKKKKSGTKSLTGSSLVDDGYYAIASDEYSVGKIVGQTVAPGEEYDGTKPGDNSLKIKVIGTVLEFKGKTGGEFTEELLNCGFGNFGYRTSSGDNGEAGWAITDVKVYPASDDKDGYDSEEELKYFKNESEDDRTKFFEITVKPPETAPTQSRPAAEYSVPVESLPSHDYDYYNGADNHIISDNN